MKGRGETKEQVDGSARSAFPPRTMPKNAITMNMIEGEGPDEAPSRAPTNSFTFRNNDRST